MSTVEHTYIAFSGDNVYLTRANRIESLITNVVQLPAKIEHRVSNNIVGNYVLARPLDPLLNEISCYDYVPVIPVIPAEDFIDPYDKHDEPLPPLHSRTPPMESRGHIDAGLHVSITDLQAIALSVQLQIRAQRKQDESLYNADTITEHEWKARRHHNTVLSNTVQQILSLAELKAIALDTPLKGTPAHDTSNNSTICNCGHCQALRND